MSVPPLAAFLSLLVAIFAAVVWWYVRTPPGPRMTPLEEEEFLLLAATGDRGKPAPSERDLCTRVVDVRTIGGSVARMGYYAGSATLAQEALDAAIERIAQKGLGERPPPPAWAEQRVALPRWLLMLSPKGAARALVVRAREYGR